MRSETESPSRPGWVALVGAGPGDPGLFTLRGRRLLQEADVVLYDHLASPAVLATVDVPGQERIHVGKSAGKAYASQETINGLILKRALAGQKVVRLKGGDPFVFGRGAEEVEALAPHGITVEIVPGISSVYAVPAAAGIPVTHRDHASAFIAVTGHPRADGRFDPNAPGVDWRLLAKVPATLVILMGLGQAARWSSELIAGGLSPETPVAFIASGTLPRQVTAVTTLGEAPAAAKGLSSPAVAVVGGVVRRHEALEPLLRKPLSGQVIGLTRDADDTEDFTVLEHLGATLWPIPLTLKVPDPDAHLLDAALTARAFDELVLTSANGVRALRAAVERAGLDARAFAGVRVWAVGPATGKALWELLGLRADLLPERATADGLVARAEEVGVSGRRFLFPASRGARRVLPDGLRALGAEVIEIPCYQTIPDPTASARLQSAVEAGLTLLTVASPSAVAALVAAADGIDLPRDAVPVAAIGPTTAEAARQAGLEVTLVPEVYTARGLAEALTRWRPA